jgi:hypothetical protein
MTIKSIQDYVTEVGAPMTGIGVALFFLLRHYVTERIKSDFDKRLEDIRQKNQIQIEVLRGTTQRDIESLKSSLEASRSAAGILISRRIQSYEEYFKSCHAVYDSVLEWSSAVGLQFTPGEFSSTHDALKLEKQSEYYSKFEAFSTWWSGSTPFIPKSISRAIYHVYNSYGEMGRALESNDLKAYKALHVNRGNCELNVEDMIRKDLDIISKTGCLGDENA